MKNGFTLWFTGLSGAGKTTLSKIVAEKLKTNGRKVEILDGDEVRKNISRGSGFSKEDRDNHIMRVAYVCSLLSRNEIVAISAAISPYRELREFARNTINDFVEIYVKCSIDVVIKRDTKGLYKKAIQGEIKNFTGISDPYEEPENPELVVDTDKETPEESAQKILDKLIELGFTKPFFPKPM